MRSRGADCGDGRPPASVAAPLDPVAIGELILELATTRQELAAAQRKAERSAKRVEELTQDVAVIPELLAKLEKYRGRVRDARAAADCLERQAMDARRAISELEQVVAAEQRRAARAEESSDALRLERDALLHQSRKVEGLLAAERRVREQAECTAAAADTVAAQARAQLATAEEQLRVLQVRPTQPETSDAETQATAASPPPAPSPEPPRPAAPVAAVAPLTQGGAGRIAADMGSVLRASLDAEAAQEQQQRAMGRRLENTLLALQLQARMNAPSPPTAVVTFGPKDARW